MDDVVSNGRERFWLKVLTNTASRDSLFARQSVIEAPFTSTLSQTSGAL
jgi:hypothetical protein